MAKYDYGMLLTAKTEAVPGTPENMTYSVGGTAQVSDGLVQLDASIGPLSSGIDFAMGGEFQENAPSGLSKVAATLLKATIDGLTVALPMAGSRITIGGAPADADFVVDPGVLALFKACGMLWTASAPGEGPTGIGQTVRLGSAAPCTIKLMHKGGYRLVWTNCIATPRITFTPGGIGLVTLEFGGVFSARATETFPTTIAYGNQALAGAPVVESVGHVWGAGAVARGFSELEVTVDNAQDTVPDSNAVGGEVPAAAERTVNIAATLYGESTDADFEIETLLKTVALTGLTFAVGGTIQTPNGTRANRYSVKIPKVEVRSVTQDVIGSSAAPKITGRGVLDATVGDEFQMQWY
jgi:hypothetical protein